MDLQQVSLSAKMGSPVFATKENCSKQETEQNRTKGFKKGLLVYISLMSVLQLMGFEPCPSANVEEISYIWSFWGPF